MPGLADIFKTVLQTRPDLIGFINQEPQFKAERLLLWSWLNGRHEMEQLAEQEDSLAKGILELAKRPYLPQLSQGYTVLHHTMAHMISSPGFPDTETREDQKAVVDWMKTKGIKQMISTTNHGKTIQPLCGQSP